MLPVYVRGMTIECLNDAMIPGHVTMMLLEQLPKI